MRKNRLVIAILAAAVMGLLALAIYGAIRQKSQAPREPVPTSYSMQQVAEASTTAKCWVAISGGVYDLTPFVATQPSILSLCGTDATAAVSRLGDGGASTFSSLRIGSLQEQK